MWAPPTLRSPGGEIEVGFSVEEMRMSVFVTEPVVTRTRDGRVVLSLDGTLWDSHGQAEFPAYGRVVLVLRHYPDGRTAVPVVVDVEAETFGIGAGSEPLRPLSGLLPALREARSAARGGGQTGPADHS